VLKITRQEAIERQLSIAIWLWFHEGEVVSIHTLACSALKIARDVGTKLGKKSMLIDILNERSKELGKAAMIPQDFFKHARKDPDAVLPFDPDMTPYHMYDALVLYREIYNDINRHMDLFLLRFRLDHPEVFPGAAPVTLPKGFDVEAVRKMGRTEFFNAMAPLTKP
jgi:hypothetical protein